MKTSTATTPTTMATTTTTTAPIKCSVKNAGSRKVGGVQAMAG